ncbi:MAG: HNH endonuclease [Bacteroidetes bacterium]|nr:HNH endonuclease [Bacteroidota bacterium]
MDKEKKAMSEIRQELNDKLEKDNIIPMALYSLTSEQIASEVWCKPLLLMMEYNATDESKSAFIELAHDLHLEHILPVKYEKFVEWNNISKDIAAKWLNSAGNITLLSRAKNIEASNSPFNIKMDVYKGKGKYDTKDEK